jgi:hypothetical protein
MSAGFGKARSIVVDYAQIVGKQIAQFFLDRSAFERISKRRSYLSSLVEVWVDYRPSKQVGEILFHQD